MGFRKDSHGLVFKCPDATASSGPRDPFPFKVNDAKLYRAGHTWAMKISQIGKQKGIIRILTYSLPDLAYVKEQLGRRPSDIFIIAHSKFRERAIEIKRAFTSRPPNGINIALHSAMHSKMLLIEPHTAIITSANFGSSKWHETTVSFHSKQLHDYCVEVFKDAWEQSNEITFADILPKDL